MKPSSRPRNVDRSCGNPASLIVPFMSLFSYSTGFNSGEYAGPLKRRTDGSETPYQQKINQALKIVRAAVAASETDPEQAMRAMVTQANALQSTATDFKLTLAASEFYRHLSKCAHAGGKFTRAEAEKWAAPLLTFLPKDADTGRGREAA